MEAHDLHLAIDYVGNSGVVFSPEQKASLQTSLCILQNNYKFDRVYFWGKILGIKDDYFIAQGVEKDEFEQKKTLYSKNCIQWGLLPPATEERREQAKLVKGRFIGDPSFEFEHSEKKDNEEEEMITIKEENRLAAVIAEIDNDVRIVPRGAFIRTATGNVYDNKSFQGLSIMESSKFHNYVHFREHQKLQNKSLIERANFDKAIDFMDSIDEDIPKESWALQFERGSGLVTLRSLSWLGYVFYHVPRSNRYGSIYLGTGERNIDLPFML